MGKNYLTNSMAMAQGVISYALSKKCSTNSFAIA